MAQKKNSKKGSASQATPKKAARKSRKRRTREEKAAILAEYDGAARGTKGTVLAKYGIPAPYISLWRKQLGSAPKRVGRKPGRAKGSIAPGAPDLSLLSSARDVSALQMELQQAKETIKGLRSYLVKLVEWIDMEYPRS